MILNNLAIIIPYFKINFFEETLESLAAQTDQRFNVYIGNDASLDSPAELLEKYKGKFNFTYHKFEKNLGSISLTKQWERCIEMMQDEEWLMILGDDDVLGDNVVEEFYKNYEEFNGVSNVIRYSTQVIDGNGNSISKVYIQPEFENALESYYRKFIGENRGSLSEFVFRSSQYIKFKFKNYPLAWTTDDRAVIDFAENKDIFSINIAKIYFRKSSFHITSKQDNKDEKEKAHLQSLKELIFDYHPKMNKKQRVFFVQLYENQVLSFSNVKFKDYLVLFYFFYRFMSFNSNIFLFKTFIVKLLVNVLNNLKHLIINFILSYFTKNPKVLLIEETINYIIKSKLSVSRFGDGELMIMLGHNIGFQKKDEKLQKKLIEIFKTNSNKLIITLPDVFTKQKLALRTEKNQIFWKKHLQKHRKDWYQYIDKNKTYFNTAISRFYSPMKDKEQSKKNAELLKKIWNGENLLILEGEYSRLGIGNDLFTSANSIERIICPSKNAFDKYEEILNLAIKNGTGKLILIALGPTATVLAYDLSQLGFWAIDLGHVDMEYMWMKFGVNEPVAVKGRVLNEVFVAQNESLEEGEKGEYLKSIINKIE